MGIGAVVSYQMLQRLLTIFDFVWFWIFKEIDSGICAHTSILQRNLITNSSWNERNSRDNRAVFQLNDNGGLFCVIPFDCPFAQKQNPHRISIMYARD